MTKWRHRLSRTISGVAARGEIASIASIATSRMTRSIPHARAEDRAAQVVSDRTGTLPTGQRPSQNPAQGKRGTSAALGFPTNRSKPRSGRKKTLGGETRIISRAATSFLRPVGARRLLAIYPGRRSCLALPWAGFCQAVGLAANDAAPSFFFCEEDPSGVRHEAPSFGSEKYG
jgi:hypothetical protein